MLVLTRKSGEKLIVTIPPSAEPREVEITLFETRSGGRARLGIEADRDIGVHRANPEGIPERFVADAFEAAQ